MECLNCKVEFEQSDNYCRTCGQKTSTQRLTTKHAVHHFLHAFTHTDKGFFYLIPKLLVIPGIIAREYNEGKRMTYFSPFTFVLIVIALSTLIVSTFNIMLIPYANRPQHPAVEMVSNFTNKHFNLVVFLSIPLISFFTTQFFKKRINYAESMVIVSYTSGERSIFFMLIVVPFLLLFKEHYYLIIWSYIALYMVYYSWSCCQYFNDYRISTFIKGSLSFVLAQAITSFIIALTIFALVIQSKL
jgi:hypothetical protein